MPTNKYTALANEGRTVDWQRVTESVEALTEELKNRRLLIQMASELGARFWFFSVRVLSDQQLLFFNQEFMVRMSAGLAIPEVLDLAAECPDNPFPIVTLKLAHH